MKLSGMLVYTSMEFLVPFHTTGMNHHGKSNEFTFENAIKFWKNYFLHKLFQTNLIWPPCIGETSLTLRNLNIHTREKVGWGYYVCSNLQVYLKYAYISFNHATQDSIWGRKNETRLNKTTYFFVAPAKQSTTYGSLCPSSVRLSVRPSVCLSVTLLVCW